MFLNDIFKVFYFFSGATYKSAAYRLDKSPTQTYPPYLGNCFKMKVYRAASRASSNNSEKTAFMWSPSPDSFSAGF